MNTHMRARRRIIAALETKGFLRQDAQEMIDDTLAAVRADEAAAVEICEGLLGLELEYILPLLRPAERVLVG